MRTPASPSGITRMLKPRRPEIAPMMASFAAALHRICRRVRKVTTGGVGAWISPVSEMFGGCWRRRRRRSSSYARKMSYSTMPATHANRLKQAAISMNLRNSMALLLCPKDGPVGRPKVLPGGSLPNHAVPFPTLRLAAVPRVVSPLRHQAGEAVQPDPFEPECQSQRRDDCSCYLCESDKAVHGRLLSGWACKADQCICVTRESSIGGKELSVDCST